MPYDGDTFFHLSIGGRWGLAALSLALSGLVFFCMYRLSRAWPRVWRIAAACVVFYAFVWLSPQVYYSYYRLIIDGLPAQVVVNAPPSPLETARLLAFSAAPTLSDHGKGALGWAMLLQAVIGPWSRRDARRDP
ncbi:MAG: hypothetical protein AAFY03_02465 [Pseudomonadota bacterium]